MNGDLFEIRCPAELTTKSGYKIRCDHLCCIAAKGSVIQIKCRHCKTTFEAYIPEDAKTSKDVAFRIIDK
ncbi:MAG: hypothetical protein NC218_04055 [Acetobacter sp.]|nr:hypothetical protein [Acetobacter sp.]